ncbi:chloride channel protein A-like isoform X2 [Octopus sinensis]|uniref:Chloride channel protein n=1 Tax=Octopus sinensis TaxID=2607531 RepID=A0A6P7T1P2_9MOLL|nr:chloride channel protein A-like isoform X2 [Octopus sinensis]
MGDNMANHRPLFRRDKENSINTEPTSYVSDDRYKFLTEGRDYQPADVSHIYTDEEKETLANYESQNYLPSHSLLYRRWLQTQKEKRFNTLRWVVMGLIGMTVGIIGFLLHQGITLLFNTKLHMQESLFEKEEYDLAWLWSVGYAVIFVFISSASVVFLKPSAGGSGMPQVSAYLNGTYIPDVFSMGTLLVKFVSCLCAIGSGMPVGPEAPMVHMGALIGACLGQVRFEKLNVNLAIFQRLRNSQDRRNFISAGAAAGIASAFGAPIGGLLFSMEEVSSFWTKSLSWQIFFCCMVATFVTDLLNSVFHGYQHVGTFGHFEKEHYVLFHLATVININVLLLIPTIVIGITGGILGAFFTFLKLKMARMRKKLLFKMPKPIIARIIHCIEPIICMVIIATVYIYIPDSFGCTQFTCITEDGNTTYGCYNDTRADPEAEPNVIHYKCNKGSMKKTGTMWYTNGTYNEVATLLLLPGEDAVKNLFSRNTHLNFGFPSVACVLVLHFLSVSWASGTAVACGILVPVVFIGGLCGRLVGITLVNILKSLGSNDPHYWNWSDPGVFALIGAASFFGGVTRLTMAVTVIMIEITNDVQFLLPIMFSVLIAKWIGDYFTHPFYHAILELKCIPFLRAEPHLVLASKRLNAELYTAFDVMASPVVTVYPKQSVYKVAKILLTTTHSGFPVAKKQTMLSKSKHFYGLITRKELYILLMKEEVFCTKEEIENESEKVLNKSLEHVTYKDISNDIMNINLDEVETRLQKYVDDPKYQDLYIDLLYVTSHLKLRNNVKG